MDFQLSLQTETVGSAHPAAPLAATDDTSLSQVLHLLRAENAGGASATGALLVCNQHDELTGIYTERDALRLMAKLANASQHPAEEVDLSAAVGDAISGPAATVNQATTVREAIRQMSQGGYRHLPIIDDQGKPSGTLSTHGLVHYVVEHFPGTIYNLPPTSTQVSTEREGA